MKSYFRILAAACALSVTPISAFAAPAGTTNDATFPSIVVTSTQANLNNQRLLLLDGPEQAFVAKLRDPEATPIKQVPIPAGKYRIGLSIKQSAAAGGQVIQAFHTKPAGTSGETTVKLAEKLALGEYSLTWQVESVENPARHGKPSTIALTVVASPAITAKRVTRKGDTTSVEVSVNPHTSQVAWFLGEADPKKGTLPMPAGYAAVHKGKASLSFATPRQSGVTVNLTPTTGEGLFNESNIVKLVLETAPTAPTPTTAPTRTPKPVPTTTPTRTTQPVPTTAPTRTTAPARPVADKDKKPEPTTSKAEVREDVVTKVLVALGVQKSKRPLANTGING